MRNIKKLLALMLVIVMALGMVPMAGAYPAAVANVDDFTDAANIDDDYVEAVDVLAALGVYVGDGPEGARAFDPTSNFTRGQAAAIMARILLGSERASSLPRVDTGYSDVPAGHWAAGYVGFGKDREIILGYGDGTFGVDDPVTALQMARLLLRAIGYGTEGELEGPGWEVRTVERATARNVRVLWGTGEIDYSAPATREQVAQYTFNALVNTRTVTWNTILNTYTTWSTVLFTGDELPTLGERTFGLEKRGESNRFGFNEHFWFVDSVAFRITKNYLSGNIVDSFVAGAGHTKAYLYNNYTWDLHPISPGDVAVFLNGSPLGTSEGADFAARGITNKWPFATGLHITLVDEDWDGVIDKVVATFEVLARVDRVNTATGVISLQAYNLDYPVLQDTIPLTTPADGFNVNDYVVIAPPMSSVPSDLGTVLTAANVNLTGIPAPLSIANADSFTARASNRFGDNPSIIPPVFPTVSVDGKTYTFSAGIGLGRSATVNTTAEATYYLDSHGSVVGHTSRPRSAASLDYLFVTAAAGSIGNLAAGTGASAHVNVIYSDGSTGNSVRLPVRRGGAGNAWRVSMYTSSGALNDTSELLPEVAGSIDALVNKWFSYTTNEDGSLNLFELIAGETSQLVTTGNTLAVAPNRSSVAVGGVTAPAGKENLAKNTTVLSLFREGSHRELSLAQFPGSAANPESWTMDTTAATRKVALIVYGTAPETRIEKIFVLDGSTPPTTVYGIITEVGQTYDEGYRVYRVYSGGTGDEEFRQYEPHATTHGELKDGDIVSFSTVAGVRVISPVGTSGTTTSLVSGLVTGTSDSTYLRPKATPYGPGSIYSFDPIPYRSSSAGGVLFFDLVSGEMGSDVTQPIPRDSTVTFYAVASTGTDVLVDVAGNTSIVAVVITRHNTP